MIKKEIMLNEDGKPYNGKFKEFLTNTFRVEGEYENGYPKGVFRQTAMRPNEDGSFKDVLVTEDFYEGTGVNSYLREHITYDSKETIIHNEYYEPLFNDKGICIKTRPVSYYSLLTEDDEVNYTYEYEDNLEKEIIERSFLKGLMSIHHDIVTHLNNGHEEYKEKSSLFKYNDEEMATMNYITRGSSIEDINISLNYIATEGLMATVTKNVDKKNVYTITVYDRRQGIRMEGCVSNLEMEKMLPEIQEYMYKKDFDIVNYEKDMIELLSDKIF